MIYCVGQNEIVRPLSSFLNKIQEEVVAFSYLTTLQRKEILLRSALSLPLLGQ